MIDTKTLHGPRSTKIFSPLPPTGAGDFTAGPQPRSYTMLEEAFHLNQVSDDGAAGLRRENASSGRASLSEGPVQSDRKRFDLNRNSILAGSYGRAW